MATELRDPQALTDLYESDFYAWARHQAAALRDFQATRPNLPLDLEHLSEEVDDLADAKLGAVKSQLRRVIVHYLKLEYSPAELPRRKWQSSIIDAQAEIDDDLTPSIRREADGFLPKVYKAARRLAAAELLEYGERESAASLPEACPYTLDQLLDETWRPTSRHGLVDEPF